MEVLAGSGGATGAGARGLNLSEAKGRDVCAGAPSTMIAAGKTIEHEASPGSWNKEGGTAKPHKTDDSADCCRSTTRDVRSIGYALDVRPVTRICAVRTLSLPEASARARERDAEQRPRALEGQLR